MAIKIIQARGMKRFLRQILAIKGKVVFKGKKVERICLNPLYPFITRIQRAFEAFFKPYHIQVLLDES